MPVALASGELAGDCTGAAIDWIGVQSRCHETSLTDRYTSAADDDDDFDVEADSDDDEPLDEDPESDDVVDPFDELVAELPLLPELLALLGRLSVE